MAQLPDPVDLFGDIDVYLFDQLLRGRVAPGASVLDAGCGGGRNLRYFLKAGHDVAGCDRDPEAIRAVRRLAGELQPDAVGVHEERFRVEALEDCSFEQRFDLVICNAVLHFADDDSHFARMLAGAWRPLRVGGVFFARLASSIGLQDRIAPLGRGRFALPDGSERYLVDEARLATCAAQLGGEPLDPLKTTNVQNLRCMTTWVLRRTT